MKKNILCCEDDPFTQELYEIILPKAGYNPIIVEDGEKIFQILNKEKIELIILDLSLKNTFINGEKSDGYKLSQLIKQSNDNANIPILIVTAHSTSLREKNFFASSLADDYFIKPITDFNALIKKINLLISNEKS